MSYLALLLGLALQQVLSPGNALQARGWLLRWEAFLGRYVAAPAPRAALLLASLVLAGWWLLDHLAGWAFALPALVANAGLFVWSLGSRDYHTALERFEARVGVDPDGAAAATAALWMPADAQPATVDGSPSAPVDVLEQARRRLLYAGYARWFAPLFYYLLAGPLAAVTYRATAVLAASAPASTYLKVLAVLDWLPARLVVLTFALTGDFLAVVQRGGEQGLLARAPAPGLLRVGAGAACGGDDARAAADLLYRSAGLWVLLLSMAFLLF